MHNSCQKPHTEKAKDWKGGQDKFESRWSSADEEVRGHHALLFKHSEI